jgi:hypothetical protein
MGLFSKSKTAEPPQATPIAYADKRIILNFGAKASAAAREMAAATLEAGGFEHSRDGLPPIGTKMPDGTVYAGISPDSGLPMFTAAQDASERYSYSEAWEIADILNARKHLGHDDWRVPTKAELNVLFNNRAAIGNFDKTGERYWSSTTDRNAMEKSAVAQVFNDGRQSTWMYHNNFRVRLVCSDGPKLHYPIGILRHAAPS